MSNTDIDDLHNTEPENNEENVDKEWQEAATGTADSDSQLGALKAQYDELEDKYKRIWADQQNMVNRFNREKADILKFAAANTLEAILPAVDNFGFAKKSITEETKFEDIVKSIDMLEEQILMSLKAVGLEEIKTDIPFDPNLHEAVSNLPDAEKDEGTIIEVLKKGYKVNDRVLRVATVVVTTKG